MLTEGNGGAYGDDDPVGGLVSTSGGPSQRLRRLEAAERRDGEGWADGFGRRGNRDEVDRGFLL